MFKCFPKCWTIEMVIFKGHFVVVFFNSMGSTLPLTFRKRLKSVGKQCQWTASSEMGKAVKNHNIYDRGKKQMEQCCKWTEAPVKTKSYLSLPLFRFWLNVGLNHSCSSPAVMGWEWSQDMVLTPEVPVCTPSHLLLSPLRLIVASVLVPNSEWSLQRNWGCETHLSVKSSCVSHPDSLFPWEVCLFGSEDSSHSSECLCPTWKRSFFWPLPNPYFLSKPDSNHGCASMCRTKRNPGSKSTGQLAQTQKEQIWDPGSFSEGSSWEPVFVGSRSLAILNSGSGSGSGGEAAFERKRCEH